MKITDVRTFVVGNRWKNWIFVKVHTDEGLVGLGEATGGLATRMHEADFHELKRFVIGEDPLHPERLWHKMWQGRFLRSTVSMTGIELACWDILGRALNAPVWQLLGGALRDSLRVYANGWYQGPREPGFFAERATAMVEAGYTALKFDPFGSAYLTMGPTEDRRTRKLIGAVRDAVGPDVELLIEGHDRFNTAEAIRIGTWLADYDPLLFEEPVPGEDVAGSIEVAEAVPVRVALGERFDRLRMFGELLASRAISIVQPEIMHLGVSNAKKACGIAQAYDAQVALHQAQSPFCTAVNANLHATLPNFLLQENFDDSFDPWTWELLSGVPRVEDGHLPLPTGPGWGVELDEAVVDRYPYGETNFLRLFDDGWERRDS